MLILLDDFDYQSVMMKCAFPTYQNSKTGKLTLKRLLLKLRPKHLSFGH